MIDPVLNAYINQIAEGLQQQVEQQGYYPPPHEIAALMVTFSLNEIIKAIQYTMAMSKEERFDYMLLVAQQRDSLLGR